MLITIGKCSICKTGDVARDTSVVAEDECLNCGSLRSDYFIPMYMPKPTAKRNVYNEIEADFLERRDGIIRYPDMYSLANH